LLLQIRQCDPGPAHMCLNCLGHLETWEEFKQKCKTSNEYIQNHFKRLEDKKLNLAMDESVNFKDELQTKEQDNNYDSTFDNELNSQDSNNDSLKSKSPISITVIQLLSFMFFHYLFI